MGDFVVKGHPRSEGRPTETNALSGGEGSSEKKTNIHCQRGHFSADGHPLSKGRPADKKCPV